VRAKKTKKPARSIRYLLSANPKFQRISVRRLSPPSEQAKKAPRKARSIEPGSAKRAFVLAAVFITTVGVLIAASRPSRPAGVAATDAQHQATPRVEAVSPQYADTTPDKTDATARRDAPKTVVAKALAAPAAAETHSPEATAKLASPVETRKTPAAAAAPELNAKPLPSESAAPATVQSSSPVTITGCLETDEETFWLKDTSGADSPRSRSWKWGFMKKRSSNIELVDPSHALELGAYVGQRITATGMLTGREMRAHSLQPVASSCN